MNSRNLSNKAILYVVAILSALAFSLPFFWTITSSFKSAAEIVVFPPAIFPERLRWENYADVFNLAPFARFMWNTVYVTTFAMIGQILSSAVVAFGFARFRFPGRETLFLLVLGTMMLPWQVTIVPTFLLFKQFKMINTYWPLILPSFLGGGAFYIFLLRQFFLTIPRDYDDAAYIDGCNPMSLFWRIHLPLSLPALGVVNIFQLTFIWNDFINPLIYLHKEPQFTVALGLRLFQGRMSNNMQDLMAASLLAVLPTLIIFFFAQRYFVQGIVVSGVKG